MLVVDAAQAHWHLGLGLPGRNGCDTNIRIIFHKGKKEHAISGNFVQDLKRAQQWQTDGRCIYLQVNPGGTKVSKITACIALFFEYDNLSRLDQLQIWAQPGLPQPMFQVDAGGKSIHHYYALEVPISVG